MDLFDLAAKITLDTSEYERGLNNAIGKTASFGASIKSGLATAAKAGVAAIGTAAAAVGTLIKSSVEGYAEYEQLVGGVETLFGDSADKVQEYAANAFKTAGLSANEYMETVTSFSASLLQSLGGDASAAADYADMAIRDMSDNANKMGTDMSLIQSAYQGFAKQNYTMLDNLKLGYGGTKSEMERLITDAEALDSSFTATRDANGDLAMSYADIVDAIHIVQDNMGITGTTAEEASKTISGSISAMKSAWTNLVTGMADENADFGTLVNNFVESVVTVGSNLVPRVKQALTGVGTLITELAPVIAEQVPTLISDILPSLLEAGASLVSSLGEAIIENLPLLIDTGFQLILTLAQSLGESLPELIPSIVGIILEIVNTLTDPANLTALIDAAVAIIMGLANGLIAAVPQLIAAAPTIITNLVNALAANLPQLLVMGVQLIIQLVSGLIQAIPQIASAAPQIIMAIVEGLVTNFGNLLTAGQQIIESVRNGVMSAIANARQWGQDLIENFKAGITAKLASLKSAVSGVASTIKSLLGFSEPEEGPLSNFHTYAPDMMDLFAKGVRDNENVVRAQIEKSFDFGEIGTINGTTPMVGTSSDSGIVSAMQEMVSAIQGMGLYMDTGVLVGQVSPGVDNNLGGRYNYAQRGLAV
jgi:hypothetical protein